MAALALSGLLISPLPLAVVAALLAAVAIGSLLIDLAKVRVFRMLGLQRL
ncbi:MAG: hypothetical protein KGJ86_08415 [Chloroflexota bacterium]|nr:hypothetical protein [Chloroflexota bacterium]